MKVAAKHDSIKPLRALSVAALTVTLTDCQNLGVSRRRALKKGREWSKFSKAWGMLRRLICFLNTTRFALMCDVIEQDVDVIRHRMLAFLAAEDEDAKAERTCPRCGHHGFVDIDFGYRNYRGRVVAQSWCRRCR